MSRHKPVRCVLSPRYCARILLALLALSAALAQALPEDGTLIACDVSTEWTNVGRPFWERAGVDQKIDLRIAPAVETLDSLLANGGEGSVDMMFIDADKVNYDNYFERGLRLLRKNGLMVVDNVFWGGRVVDDSDRDEDTMAIRALNEKISGDERVDISMIAVGDGLFLARKV